MALTAQMDLTQMSLVLLATVEMVTTQQWMTMQLTEELVIMVYHGPLNTFTLMVAS